MPTSREMTPIKFLIQRRGPLLAQMIYLCERVYVHVEKRVFFMKKRLSVRSEASAIPVTEMKKEEERKKEEIHRAWKASEERRRELSYLCLLLLFLHDIIYSPQVDLRER